MSPDAIERMLVSCEENSHGLTKWEANFIDSLRTQFEERGALSERQVEILDRIYVEKTY